MKSPISIVALLILPLLFISSCGGGGGGDDETLRHFIDISSPLEGKIVNQDSINVLIAVGSNRLYTPQGSITWINESPYGTSSGQLPFRGFCLLFCSAASGKIPLFREANRITFQYEDASESVTVHYQHLVKVNVNIRDGIGGELSHVTIKREGDKTYESFTTAGSISYSLVPGNYVFSAFIKQPQNPECFTFTPERIDAVFTHYDTTRSFSFNASKKTIDCYEISGSVQSNFFVTPNIQLTDSLGNKLSVFAIGGTYRFPHLASGTYIVEPLTTAPTVLPANSRTVEITGANVLNVDFDIFFPP